jgi:hypothetical protein
MLRGVPSYWIQGLGLPADGRVGSKRQDVRPSGSAFGPSADKGKGGQPDSKRKRLTSENKKHWFDHR